MILCFSLGGFYHWKNKYDFEAQLNYIKILEKLDIDGFELHLTSEEIIQEKLLTYENNSNKLITLHFPKIFTQEAIEKLYGLKDYGVKYFIVHADLYDSSLFPKDLPILIENSDLNKPKGQDISEILKFDRDICFDINHSIESMGKEKAQEQYNLGNDKIKEIHLSANLNYQKYENIETSHYLYAEANDLPPKYLDKKLNWVLEGVIPHSRVDLIEKEIKLVRNLKN